MQTRLSFGSSEHREVLALSFSGAEKTAIELIKTLTLYLTHC